jgi:hypothetical protein
MPTAITKERLKGRHITIICGGVKTHWTDFDCEGNYEVENPQGADATFKQKILDITDAKATLTGFVGASNNTFNLLKRGAEVEDLEFSVDEETIIDPDLLDVTLSGKWRVLSVKTNGSKDSAKWTMTLEAGFID